MNVIREQMGLDYSWELFGCDLARSHKLKPAK
jgi:hypothetical protein